MFYLCAGGRKGHSWRDESATGWTCGDRPSWPKSAAPASRNGTPTPRAARPPESRRAAAAARGLARWGVFDGAMKLVETFDYNQRTRAEERVAELNAARKNGTTYFLQIVKEAVPPAGPVDLD